MRDIVRFLVPFKTGHTTTVIRPNMRPHHIRLSWAVTSYILWYLSSVWDALWRIECCRSDFQVKESCVCVSHINRHSGTHTDTHWTSFNIISYHITSQHITSYHIISYQPHCQKRGCCWHCVAKVQIAKCLAGACQAARAAAPDLRWDGEKTK